MESQALPTLPPIVPLSALWTALLDGLNPIWPSRPSLGGIALGDVWPCRALAQLGPVDPDSDTILVPFHKLTQWLTYSLVEVLQKILGWKVEGLEDMTGLPEYRNGVQKSYLFWYLTLSCSLSEIGGLLVDLGVLTLKQDALPLDTKSGLPIAPPSHPAIVEWRAMTVIELYVPLTTIFTWWILPFSVTGSRNLFDPSLDSLQYNSPLRKSWKLPRGKVEGR